MLQQVGIQLKYQIVSLCCEMFCKTPHPNTLSLLPNDMVTYGGLSQYCLRDQGIIITNVDLLTTRSPDIHFKEIYLNT